MYMYMHVCTLAHQAKVAIDHSFLLHSLPPKRGLMKTSPQEVKNHRGTSPKTQKKSQVT